MGLVDFLQDWTITTIILAAAVLTLAVLAGSFALALAWRRWKEGQRARRARPGAASPAGPTGTGFVPRAALHKLPKPGLPNVAAKLGGAGGALARLKRKR